MRDYDPESKKSTPEFLYDPKINEKVDYLLVGLGTHENQPANRSVVFIELRETGHGRTFNNVCERNRAGCQKLPGIGSAKVRWNGPHSDRRHA